jgi:CRP/FNR family cyclic AMP-dependent transcriptional regulator
MTGLDNLRAGVAPGAVAKGPGGSHRPAATLLRRMDAGALLGQSEFFGGFDSETVATLAGASSRRHLDRNEVVFGEGAEANELFVVDNGRIAIANRSPDGRESVVALMESGDLFGELPLFDGEARSAEARALEPSELISVPYPALHTILRARPELLWGVVALLARRLRSTDAALADSFFLDVTGRTAKRLLELAGESDRFVMPLTQEELAAMVGASRERVNKAIAAFVRLGWLTQAERQYRITDRVQLERRAR